ncbi:MAG: RNA polymerase sigma-70 factor [Bacteroidales bacterium]|nr:RNA polymerase sigma-70 factor [Bacteroidales bacterium]MDD3989145.1 RNA polymerase sigma-70 factor [Bacteroidales bacterium]MDD4638421.1 RNA polymerase sigma-70 factor [Bacteroidales bacterium]
MKFNDNSGDIILLNLIKEGDQKAFRNLFDCHYTAVVRYIGFYIRDYSEAEQLALDIFAYIWENRDNLKINLSFRAYLMTAARNRSLNYLRNRSSDNKGGNHNIEKIYEEYQVELKELDKLVREAVSSLPSKCGQIFRLSREENLSNREISEKTGISVKTIEAHITKALKLIRKYLGDSYNYLW